MSAPLGRPRQSLLHKFSALSDRPGRPPPPFCPIKASRSFFVEAPAHRDAVAHGRPFPVLEAVTAQANQRPFGRVLDVLDEPAFNHRPEVRSGVLQEECAAVLRAFFAARRGR